MSHAPLFNSAVFQPFTGSLLNLHELRANTAATPDPNAMAAKTAYTLKAGAENITGVSELIGPEQDTPQGEPKVAPVETPGLT